MPRTITVKGTGSVTASPDLTEISMTLATLDMDYEKAMADAAKKIEELTSALETEGFEKDSLKTLSFNVQTAYDYIYKPTGENERVFKGYQVIHGLKLELGFDTERLAGALSVIGGCVARPELSVRFTVKDREAVSDALLVSAADNARKKAQVLCRASGKSLGELLSIDYSWGELNVYSPTTFDMAEECLEVPMLAKNAAVRMVPEDIKVKDTVTFVWEIV